MFTRALSCLSRGTSDRRREVSRLQRRHNHDVTIHLRPVLTSDSRICHLGSPQGSQDNETIWSTQHSSVCSKSIEPQSHGPSLSRSCSLNGIAVEIPTYEAASNRRAEGGVLQVIELLHEPSKNLRTNISPRERCFQRDGVRGVELAAYRCMATSIGGLSMEHKSELVVEAI